LVHYIPDDEELRGSQGLLGLAMLLQYRSFMPPSFEVTNVTTTLEGHSFNRCDLKAWNCHVTVDP
jgi:hypothetical protein